jgi:hypothetical protein
VNERTKNHLQLHKLSTFPLSFSVNLHASKINLFKLLPFHVYQFLQRMPQFFLLLCIHFNTNCCNFLYNFFYKMLKQAVRTKKKAQQKKNHLFTSHIMQFSVEKKNSNTNIFNLGYHKNTTCSNIYEYFFCVAFPSMMTLTS